MNKKIYTCLIVFFILVKASFAQAPLAATNPNFLHDKLEGLYSKSATVKLPDSVYTILKNYAFNTGLPQAAVLKNDLCIQVLYNPNLTIEDRIFYADFLLRPTKEPIPYIPMFLLESFRANLVSQIKKD